MKLDDLRGLPPTISVEQAGEILGLSRPSAYAAGHRYLESNGAEGLPVLRLGRRMRVPTARLLAMLGMGDAIDGSQEGQTTKAPAAPTDAPITSLRPVDDLAAPG